MSAGFSFPTIGAAAAPTNTGFFNLGATPAQGSSAQMTTVQQNAAAAFCLSYQVLRTQFGCCTDAAEVRRRLCLSSAAERLDSLVSDRFRNVVAVKPKAQTIPEELSRYVFDVMVKFQGFREQQKDFERPDLRKATNFTEELKRFDESFSKYHNQFSEISSVVDNLAKGTTDQWSGGGDRLTVVCVADASRVLANARVARRLSDNPQASLTQLSPVIETYFTDIRDVVRTELEKTEEGLILLETLHEKVLRPERQSSASDLENSFAYLSGLVSRVTEAAEELKRTGDELRREVQNNKNATVSLNATAQLSLFQEYF